MKKKVCVILWLASAILMAFAMVGPVKVNAEEAGNKYGSITSLVGDAEITGDKTENVEVLYEELNLEWCEADEEIGRNVNGWWVGIKIAAPEGSDAETLKKVKFTSNGVERNFWDLKDSGDEDSTHWIGAWSYVDEAKLDGDSVFSVGQYQFDWDCDGEYEQTIDVKVKPDGVTLERDEDVVAVTIGDRQFTLKKGNTLEDLTDEEKDFLAKIEEAPEGKVFVGLFKEDGTELKEDDAINEDMTLTAKFDDIVTSEPEQPADEPATDDEPADEPATEETPAEDKDESPKTGNVSIIGYVAIVAVISAIGIAVINKRK